MKKQIMIGLFSILALSAQAATVGEVAKKLVQMFEANDFEELRGTPINPKLLKGQAARYFKEVDQTDYPASVSMVQVGQDRVIQIYEGNDGGAGIAFFDSNGRMIASCDAGESTPWKCSP